MIDNFITKRIPTFKKAFPQYSNYKLLCGIGALVVKDEVGRYAEKSGLYVLTQTSDGGASLINQKNFNRHRIKPRIKPGTQPKIKPKIKSSPQPKIKGSE